MNFINCTCSKFYYPLASTQLFSNTWWLLLPKLSSKFFKQQNVPTSIAIVKNHFSLYVPSFDIAVNGVDIIISSCFCWLGWYFCPVLSVLTLLNIGLTFYSKWISIAFFCLPPKEMFKILSYKVMWHESCGYKGLTMGEKYSTSTKYGIMTHYHLIRQKNRGFPLGNLFFLWYPTVGKDVLTQSSHITDDEH